MSLVLHDCITHRARRQRALKHEGRGGRRNRGERQQRHHDHVRKEPREVDSDGHEGNDPFDGVSLLGHVPPHGSLPQIREQLFDLAWGNKKEAEIKFATWSLVKVDEMKRRQEIHSQLK